MSETEITKVDGYTVQNGWLMHHDRHGNWVGLMPLEEWEARKAAVQALKDVRPEDREAMLRLQQTKIKRMRRQRRQR